MFDDRVYKRGALLLHALRRTVGDESFFTILRTWADRHQHATVSTELFVDLAAEVAGKDLGDVFDALAQRDRVATAAWMTTSSGSVAAAVSTATAASKPSPRSRSLRHAGPATVGASARANP